MKREIHYRENPVKEPVPAAMTPEPSLDIESIFFQRWVLSLSEIYMNSGIHFTNLQISVLEVLPGKS
jgi:hypothetical protein